MQDSVACRFRCAENTKVRQAHHVAFALHGIERQHAEFEQVVGPVVRDIIADGKCDVKAHKKLCDALAAVTLKHPKERS